MMFYTIPALFIEKSFLVIGILIVAWIVNFLLQHLIRVPKQLETRRARTYVSVFRNAITVIVYVGAIYFIFIFLGIDVTPILASAGVAGLAIGFGARSLIEDLISGIFLLTQDTISIGDYIITAGAEGIVENISLKNITIRDRDGALHIVPNGQVKQVTNLSRSHARVTIDLQVKADQDIDKVITTLQTALNSLTSQKSPTFKIFPDTGIRGIEDIQQGKMIIRTVIITRSSKRWKVARRFRYLVKKEFEKQNISFA